MAVISTSNLTLPRDLVERMFTKAQAGSTIAALSPETPQRFGTHSAMVLSASPKAELVGENGVKAASNATVSSVAVTPRKFHVTLRFSDEVRWADEQSQLGVLETMADQGALALARALDLSTYHGINPLSGAVAAGIPVDQRIVTSPNQVEAVDSATKAVEQAAALVIADGHTPNAVAFDPSYAWAARTERNAQGININTGPELAGTSQYNGFLAAVSSTVSAPEAAVATNVKAIVGDFNAIRWGVQVDVPVHLIEYGDPDGQGDLQRQNQVALRVEVVYGVAVLDLSAFAVVKDAVDETAAP